MSRFGSTHGQLCIVSLTFAVGALVAWLTLPAYSSGGTVVEQNGAWVVWLLALPAAPPAAALAACERTRGLVTALGAFTLMAFCFVTGFSIGLFYVPSAGFLIAAAIAWYRAERLRQPVN